MKKKLKKKKGLTLLELVIVLGLMGIVTSVVFSFVNITQKKSKELDIRQELQFEGTMITESMMGNVLEMKRCRHWSLVLTMNVVRQQRSHGVGWVREASSVLSKHTVVVFGAVFQTSNLKDQHQN